MARILYDMALSPNGKRARLGLAECGAPYETREINLLAGEQKTDEYKRIHPLSRIPALDDDGVVVWESGAILQYIAEKHPEAQLLPTGLADRAVVYTWLHFAEAQLHALMGAMGFQYLRRAPDKRDETVLARGRKRMPQVLASMEAQLDGKEYFAGDFSIADCANAPWLEMAPTLEIDLSPFPNVSAWLDRMRARPSWQA